MQAEQEAGCARVAANGQSRRERTQDTLFLQNWTGALKVRVAVTSFPVVSAPPATVSGPTIVLPDEGKAKSSR